MGMVPTRQDSAYNRLVAPMVKKQLLHVDGFSTKRSADVEAAVAPLIKWIDEVAPNAKNTCPLNWDTKNHVMRAVVRTFVAQSLYKEFAELLRDKTKEDLEELAKSLV